MSVNNHHKTAFISMLISGPHVNLSFFISNNFYNVHLQIYKNLLSLLSKDWRVLVWNHLSGLGFSFRHYFARISAISRHNAILPSKTPYDYTVSYLNTILECFALFSVFHCVMFCTKPWTKQLYCAVNARQLQFLQFLGSDIQAFAGTPYRI